MTAMFAAGAVVCAGAGLFEIHQFRRTRTREYAASGRPKRGSLFWAAFLALGAAANVVTAFLVFGTGE